MAAPYQGPRQTELAPDETQVCDLFAFWFHYAVRGLIEIAWYNPGSGGLTNFERFEPGDPERIAARVCEINSVPGQSVYFRPALIRPDKEPAAYTTDADFMDAPGPWADLDDRDAVLGAPKLYAALPATALVITGIEPHTRAQMFWRTDGLISSSTLVRRINENIARKLHGDTAVINPTTLMRCGGTIAWPYKPGRIIELTRFKRQFNDARPSVVPLHALTHYFPDAEPPLTAMERLKAEMEAAPPRPIPAINTIATIEAGPSAAAPTAPRVANHTQPGGQDDGSPVHSPLTGLLNVRLALRNIQLGRQWHNNMVALVAHWIARGWSDAEILTAAEAFTLPGYRHDDTIRETRKAIDGARTKYSRPDPVIDETAVIPAAQASDPPTPPLKPIPVGMLDFTTIRPRQWLLGTRFLCGATTLTIAPGGLGKSTLSLEEAVSIATGREFLEMRVHRKGRVWVYNNEDPIDELHRRIAAICIKFNIPIGEIAEEVFLNSGLDRRLVVAQEVASGVVVATPDVPALIEHIRENNIRLLVIDPFVRAHRVNENSNDAIDFVAEQFTKIAIATGCAINLVHHTRKPPQGQSEGHAGNADSARGASSLISAARIAHTLMTMSGKDAERLGVPADESRLYVRLDDAKANFSAPTDRTVWFKREGVLLPNASSPLAQDADRVGVLLRADLSQHESQAREREQARREELAKDLARFMKTSTRIGRPDAVKWLQQRDAISESKAKRDINDAIPTAPYDITIDAEGERWRLFMSVSEASKERYITKQRVD